MLYRAAVIAIALTACGRIGFGEQAPPGDGSGVAPPDPPLFPLVMPDGGVVLQLAIAPDGTWYARTFGAGVFRSIDQGMSWTRCATSPPPTGIGVGPDNAVYFTGSTMRISTDACASFSPLPASRFSNNVGRHGAFAYAMTDQGIERRESGGWSVVANVPGTGFSAFDAREGASPLLLAGSTDGVYSTDQGGVWTRRATGFTTLQIRGVAVGATKTYAITAASSSSSGGLSCGNADGSVWAPCPAGYGGVAIAVDPTNEDHVVAAVYDDLGETTDGFDTMMIDRRRAGGMPNEIVNDVDFTPAGDLVITTQGGVYVSPAGQLAFQPRKAGLYAWTPSRLLVDGRDLFVATEAGLARSLDGAPLAIDTTGIPQDVDFNDMAIDSDGDVLGLGRGLWRSSDRGASWSLVYALPSADNFHALSMELDGDRIYLGTHRRVVYAEPPYTAWSERTIGGAGQDIEDLFSNEGELWAGATMGLYVSRADDPDRSMFTRIPEVDGTVTSITALANGGLLVGTTTAVYTSDETRSAWIARMNRSTRTVLRHGEILVAATSDGVHTSRDGGATWTILAGTDGLGTRGLAIDPGSGELIYGVSGRGLERAPL